MYNPLDLLKAIKNPQQFIINYVNKSNNPILSNLVEMAQKGDTKGVENFARNIFKDQFYGNGGRKYEI